ncbi:PX domain-containing protein [Xylona heveae TC161]|uniref:PX domain-containing protein n=1 Tax=Xylona heveae (strain CBS 132557 / TC161) TaxID=1328760 RepID=A0A165HNI7_XYLHT|nr:PX domain-containing protein [Xylona heveae TC161]KZF23775.1 PX domain-containing protein [Xylona heveae TC161]
MADQAKSNPPAVVLNGMTQMEAPGSGVAVEKPSQEDPTVPQEAAPRPSTDSAPAPGQILTGKQEHYLKRELLSQQVRFEISELSSPTALQRFGAPFRSEFGEVAPIDSDLPILRYIFVHHVRNFPFLDQARETEFWQNKLQVFLESFANKHVSSSEDRLEMTKRRKLAIKAQKLVELMMVSGIPTASGYEERIRFSEIEVVDRGAQEQGLVLNMPNGHEINGWNVNIAGVRTTSVKRTVRYHQHAEFLISVKQGKGPEIFIGRRYGEFARLHKRLRVELPGKVLPPLPRKNKNSTTSNFLGVNGDDASSVSSVSTQDNTPSDEGSGLRSFVGLGHRRGGSLNSVKSPRTSVESVRDSVVLYREDQRVSLRAFLRTLLQNQMISETKAMSDFLTGRPIQLNEEEKADIQRRTEMDERRVEEQRKFYEIARQRAKELDVYMERFRRDIVESNGLTKLFREIRVKHSIDELSVEYKKFAEWLRIEVAATIYHLFLAEDNSPEMFAQAKRIHSLIPYTLLKNVIRIANPAAVMSGVLDLFLAQPFGSRSLLQRIFSMALNDGIRSFQKAIDSIALKIDDPVLCEKLKKFCDSDEETKDIIRAEAASEDIDLLVAILRTDLLSPPLTPDQIGKVFNAYVAWNNAVENVDEEMKQGAQLFASLKQLLKLYTRQRDKMMMLSIIEEPVTLQLFRDLFTIFYEPLVRVYKSANVYNSVTDFAAFFEDMIHVVERAQRQDVAADPNQTVQSFIDLCARHQDNFYKFVHEVHLHDNGLFEQLMGWLEGILEFLRNGPKGGKLDMNALFQGAKDVGQIDKQVALKEIDALIHWQEERKKWHYDKTRQKMAADGNAATVADAPGANTFKSSDFGLNEMDLQDLNIEDDDEASESEDEDENLDPFAAERKRRAKRQDRLRRTAGEPIKPPVSELLKLQPGFLAMLRMVLAD